MSKAFHLIKPTDNELRLFWQAGDLKDKLYPERYEMPPGAEEGIAEIASTPEFDVLEVPHELRLVVTSKGKVQLLMHSELESPMAIMCRFGYVPKLPNDTKIEGVRKIAAQGGSREIWDMGKRVQFSRQIRDQYPKGKHHLRLFIMMELVPDDLES